MKRRDLLGAGLALAGAALTARPASAAAVQRTRPGMPGWPGVADWDALKQLVRADARLHHRRWK